MIPRASRRTAGALLLVLCFLLLGAVQHTGLAAGATTSTTVRAAPSTTVGTGASPTFTTTPAAYPGAPAVHGASAILMDMSDGRILYSKNANERRPIASTTKIMTGILAIETLPLDRVVKASQHATDAGESEIWLVPGEELTVEQLLNGLLIKSGNDAAVALAEASAGSEKAFVERMNAKAAELGLTNTHFVTPHGLDNKAHYSSARDLAVLGRYAMQNEVFRTIVGTAKTTIPWPGHPYDRTLENHNILVGKVPFVTGIKTGYTGKAGFCLVGSAGRDGVSLVSVILGGKDKGAVFTDTRKLLEYGLDKYQQVVLTDKGVTAAEVDVPYHYGEKLPLVTQARLAKGLYKGDPVTRTVTVQSALTLPVTAGQVLGKVTYKVAGKPAGEVDLVATRSIEEPTLGVKLRYLFDRVGVLMGWRA